MMKSERPEPVPSPDYVEGEPVPDKGGIVRVGVRARKNLASVAGLLLVGHPFSSGVFGGVS
jgi:hypothetical protein